MTACDVSTGPDESVSLSLSVALAPAAPVGAAVSGAYPVGRAETFQDSTNTLVLDRVAIVINEIELKRLMHEDCEGGEEGHHDGEGHHEGCEEFEAGPFLLELPLDGSVEQVLAIDVPPDSYDKLEFEIRKPSGDSEAEALFRAENPDFENVSVRVEGTWNGEAFVYTQAVRAEQELHLDPPLEIVDGAGPANLTLTLDVSGWFRDAAGNLVDPATANVGGVNESLVIYNIKRSFRVCEDHDRDGDDDHHEGHHD